MCLCLFVFIYFWEIILQNLFPIPLASGLQNSRRLYHWVLFIYIYIYIYKYLFLNWNHECVTVKYTCLRLQLCSEDSVCSILYFLKL